MNVSHARHLKFADLSEFPIYPIYGEVIMAVVLKATIKVAEFCTDLVLHRLCSTTMRSVGGNDLSGL